MSRVAIVGGVRTPFVRAAGKFSDLSFIDLGVHVVRALVTRLSLAPTDLQELLFSTVLVDPRTPNFAREVVFRSGLPKSLPAHSVSNNCISGLVALNMLAEGIRCGRIESGLAGGSESMSRPTLTLGRAGEAWFTKLARTRDFSSKIQSLLAFRPRFLMPHAPSPKEPSTGLTMGQHCEVTAKEYNVPRLAQDELALQSHLRAVRAQKEGFFADDIEPLNGVQADNLVRGDTTLEKLSRLPAVFDRSAAGTLTAGNSSALTDGASVVALMSEAKARRSGRKVLGYLSHVEYAAIDPKLGLLMAPTVAVPRLLERARLSLSDIDVFEVHEAFAAQVLANLNVWEHGSLKIVDAKPIGGLAVDKINQWGGSIALGHPFAATGGRLVMNALRQLERSGGRRALLSVCAAGAMAAAILLERE